jgi:hypothetical protein
MNVSFVLFTFFTNLIYPSLKITSRICLEFFHVRNLSRFICPEFVQNFSCPEFVQVYLSRICPEFFMSGICLESVQNMSRFICPEFVQNFYTGQILDKFWMKPNSKYWICVKKMDNFRTISGYANIFRTISGHF